LLSSIAVLRFIPAMQAALHEPEILGLDEHLTDIQFDRASWLSESNGGRWGRYGWYLASNEHGSLRIRLPFEQEGVLKLRLWSYSPGTLAVKILDSAQVLDVPLAHLDGTIISMPMHGPTEIVVNASSDLSEEQLVVDRFVAAWSEPNDKLPSPLPLLFGISLCVGGWVIVAIGWSKSDWLQWTAGIAIVVATFIGTGQRWNLLEMARNLAVDSDVVSYMTYAKSLDWFSHDHGFYSGTFGEREPMYVALVNEWFHMWGNTLPAIRFLTVVASVLLVPATGVFIWRMSENALLGVVAAWIVAVHPVWIEESVRGLRLEVLSLLFLFSIGVWIKARGWFSAFVLGCAIGGLGLIQTPLLTVMLSSCWLAWAVAALANRTTKLRFHHWRSPQLVLVTIISMVLFLPHLYGLYTVYGDPTQPSKGYARWNANVEFPERIGTPGFPTAEEFSKNPYAGPPLSYGEYFFGLHSIPTLIKGQIKGWLESSIYMSTSFAPQIKELIFLFHASGFKTVVKHLRFQTLLILIISLGLTGLGWVYLWTVPQLFWVPFLSLWGTWYAAYLYSVRLVEPFRHTGHVYPLLLFCLLWGAFRVWCWIRPLMIDRAKHSAVSPRLESYSS
jgi:hypothetical protein